jgi:hypothetical protein
MKQNEKLTNGKHNRLKNIGSADLPESQALVNERL